MKDIDEKNIRKAWIAVFVEKYLVIVTATYQMLRHPHVFWTLVEADEDSLRRSLIYVAEAAIVFWFGAFMFGEEEQSLGFAASNAVVFVMVLIVSLFSMLMILLLRRRSGEARKKRETFSLIYYANGLIFLAMPAFLWEGNSEEYFVRVLWLDRLFTELGIWLQPLIMYVTYIYVFAFSLWISRLHHIHYLRSLGFTVVAGLGTLFVLITFSIVIERPMQ